MAVECFGQQPGGATGTAVDFNAANVWHRPVVGTDGDWAVVSFHTVPADELIEERPDSSSQDGTKQKKYLEEKKREK